MLTKQGGLNRQTFKQLKTMQNNNSLVREVGTAIGIGVLAGLAGTLAMTVSQMIEMKLTERKPSTVPADAIAKVLDVKPTNKEQKEKVSQEVHYTYGTTWGIPRGLLALAGLKGWEATLAHFVAVWGTEQIMLPNLKLAPPINEEEPQAIATDALHHAVYAITTGLVYDAIDQA